MPHRIHYRVFKTPPIVIGLGDKRQRAACKAQVRPEALTSDPVKVTCPKCWDMLPELVMVLRNRETGMEVE